MRLNPFEGQLERLARTLTDRFGTTVTCRGDQAYTDGRRIVLPSLPQPMDESLERMVVGYLDHEMAHVAFTDFKEVLRFVKKHRGFKDLLNAVEDALIEKRAMQRWPGVRANLDALFRQVKGRVTARLATARPFDRFTIAVYLKLCHHQDLLGLEGELVGFEDLLDEFPSVRNTKDAAKLSSRLLKRWLRKMTTQSVPPSSTAPAPPIPSAAKSTDDGAVTANETTSDNSPPDSDVDRGSGPDDADRPDSDPEHDAHAAQATDGDAAGQPDVDGDRNADAEASGTACDATQSDGVSESSDSDAQGGAANDSGEGAATGGADSLFVGTDGKGSLIAEIVAEAIAEAISQIDGNEQYRVFTREYDRIEVVPTADEADVKTLLARGGDAVRRLRRGLANALRSAEKKWWREDQSRGDLSPRTLHRLCLDRASLCIFRNRALVQGKSTAVSIALDASGSMSTSKMDVAHDAMRVLLEALHDLKIPTEAFTFTTGNAFDADKAAWESNVEPKVIRLRFSRFNNLEIGLIKRFEDSVKVAMRRLPCVVGTGLTPIGEAMEIGARRLIVRRETRKILLILTDGHPCCDGSDIAVFNHATYVARQVSGAGIELVGVGIMDATLCSIVEDTIVVNQIEDLPAQLCKLLGRTLKKGVAHVG